MRWKVVVALALLAGGVALGVSSFRRSLTPYVGFAEARRTGGLVQVNGTVVERDPAGAAAGERVLSFRLRDRQGEVMPVVYRGAVPANFAQSTMVVAVGRCRGGRFEARQLLVKCPSKYQPAPAPAPAGR
jgi:cytochrome c-type biogenesis protein CcmE